MSARIDSTKLKTVGILFEDEDLLVVDKPSGLAVHGGAGNDKRTILDLLAAAYDAPSELHLIHRLDRTTSGVLLVAKSRSALEDATRGWDATKKTYLALAFGVPSTGLRLQTPLATGEGPRKSSNTVVRSVHSVAFDPKFSLVELEISTGRKHQIRKHLAEAGHPIAMDDKYGDFAANKAFKRALRERETRVGRSALLHCLRISGAWSGRGGFSFTAPTPQSWRTLLTSANASVDVLKHLP